MSATIRSLIICLPKLFAGPGSARDEEHGGTKAPVRRGMGRIEESGRSPWHS